MNKYEELSVSVESLTVWHNNEYFLIDRVNVHSLNTIDMKMFVSLFIGKMGKHKATFLCSG